MTPENFVFSERWSDGWEVLIHRLTNSVAMGRFSGRGLLGRGFAVVLVGVFVALGVASGLYFAIVAPWASGPALVLTAIVAMMPMFLTAGLVAKAERRNVRSSWVALGFGTFWGALVGIATNAVAAELLFGPRF